LRLKLEGPPGARSSAKDVYKTKPVKTAEGSAALDGETATVRCTADAQFRVLALEHHRLTADEELGEAVFFVDDQGSGGAEKTVALSAAGRSVVVKSSFVPSGSGGAGAERDGVAAGNPGAPSGRASSSGGGDRRSFVGNATPPRKEGGLMGRFGTKREKEGRASREVTPGTQVDQ
ncbi:MAG: hypothetical protein Q9157_005494, partial [Trypethelium eluteriae]